MNGLLDQDDVVLNMSVLDETPLIFQNDPGKNIFYSVCNDFSDYFVPCIVERDRSEYGKIFGPLSLWELMPGRMS